MAGPRTRQKLQPRTPDFARGKRYEPDLTREPTPPFGEPYEPDLTREPAQPWNNTGPGSYWNVGLRSGDNIGIMSMVGNRTSTNPHTWHQSPYFGMAGYDFIEDRDPTLENLAFFQDIKDKDAMARDAGWHPYFNPSLIEDNPSWGTDYMTDLWGGKGRLGFRKNLDDDAWNAYANWGLEF